MGEITTDSAATGAPAGEVTRHGAPVPADRPATSTFGPFRYPAFRAIWIANLASSIGSMIQSVGAAWLMTDLTSSHRLIALVQASTTIPIMLFGVFAGAIADNYDRRKVMLASQIGMLIASAALAGLSWAKLVDPVLLLAFTLAVGIGTAMNSPAWQASVRQQVGLADLPQAIALNTISFNLARSVGPALGGLLLSLWDVSLAFAVNAVSFVAMIVVLLRWHPEHAAEPRARRAMLPAIAAGLAFCAHSSPIRRVLLRGLVVGIGLAGYQALLPAVVRDRIQGSEFDFGLLLGIFGVGSILAAFFASKARRRWGTEAVIGAGTLAFVFAQSTLAATDTMAPALLAAFVAGTGWVGTLTSINVAMQMRSPEDILGRCLSIYQAVTFGGMAVGAWLWGMAADARGLPFALHGAAIWLAVTLVVLRLAAPMPAPGEGRIAQP